MRRVFLRICIAVEAYLEIYGYITIYMRFGLVRAVFNFWNRKSKQIDWFFLKKKIEKNQFFWF